MFWLTKSCFRVVASVRAEIVDLASIPHQPAISSFNGISYVVSLSLQALPDQTFLGELLKTEKSETTPKQLITVNYHEARTFYVFLKLLSR